MIGHGQKLTRKQEAAVAALITSDTISAAAATCGVSTPTLHRWLRNDTFRATFELARRAIVQDAIAGVQSSIGEAVATLRRHLNCGQATVECRAATALIELGIRTIGMTQLHDRVAMLEEAAAVRLETRR